LRWWRLMAPPSRKVRANGGRLRLLIRRGCRLCLQKRHGLRLL